MPWNVDFCNAYIVLGIRSPVGILALPFRPLYSNMSRLSFLPFLRLSHDFFNFSDSFFTDQLNLENENRFDPLANGSGTKASQTGSDKNKFITGLTFVSININRIRGKKLELLAFLDFHQPQIVAI